jgi:formamidopyrimidine-DNA glycosylase
LPELPEVENIALGLEQALLGKTIARVRIFNAVIVKGPHQRRWRRFLAELTEQDIAYVGRRAKRLIITAQGGLTLLFQLGMTGKFMLHSQNGSRQRHKHTHLVMELSDGPVVHFIDMRRFGRVWLLDDLDPHDADAAMAAAGLGPLGPEALEVQPQAFQRMLQASRPIKALLLDQSRIAGLGNIYADESLFGAGIHPAQVCSTLTADQAQRLCREIKRVLKRAIRAGGTTFSDYRNAYGDMGRFRRRLRVYGRTGLPCRRCTSPIQKSVIAGRGTHFCSRCQPA